MNSNSIILFILAALTVTAHLGRHRRIPQEEVVAVRPAGNYTVLESKVLEDGRRLERVQEHAEELPDLPISELENEIGDVDEDGRVLVPLDANGNVPPEYKHLLEPIVHEMKFEDILRLNNTEKVVVFAFSNSTPPSPNCTSFASQDGSACSSSPLDTVDFVPGCEVREDGGRKVIVCLVPSQIEQDKMNSSPVGPIAPYAPIDDNDDLMDQGTEYDEAPSEPAASLPQANDYRDSQEVDPDLARAEYDEAEEPVGEVVETPAEVLEPAIPSAELRKLEEQIRLKAELEKEAIKELEKEDQIVETEDRVIEKEEEMKDIEEDLRRIEEGAQKERQGETDSTEEQDKESGKKQLQMEEPEEKLPEPGPSTEHKHHSVVEAVKLEIPVETQTEEPSTVLQDEEAPKMHGSHMAPVASETPESKPDREDIDTELLDIVSDAFSDDHIIYGPVKILKKSGASWEVQPEDNRDHEQLVKVGAIGKNYRSRSKPRPDAGIVPSVYVNLILLVASYLFL